MDSINSIEGQADSDWVLIDGKDILVNVFTKDARDYYELDKFYGEI